MFTAPPQATSMVLHLMTKTLFSRTEKPMAPAIWLSTFFVQEQLDDEDSLQDVVFADGFLCGLGDDPLVGLAVDHDLPFSGANRLGAAFQGAHGLAFFAVEVFALFGLLPDRQAPLFEQVNRIVDVAAQVEDQVFADDAHQVVADHADVVVRGVFADVGVDGRQALCHGAAALHGGLVHQQGGHSIGQPLFDLKGRTAACHAAAHDQNVHFPLFDFGIPHRFKFTFGFVR
jgi:hypothetical protein